MKGQCPVSFSAKLLLSIHTTHNNRLFFTIFVPPYRANLKKKKKT